MKNNSKIVVLGAMTVTSIVLAALLFITAFRGVYTGLDEPGTTTEISATESLTVSSLPLETIVKPTEEMTTENITKSGDDDTKAELNVQFRGDKLYSGGQATKDEFTVTLVKGDGASEEIVDYDCPKLNSDYRLSEGENVFTFSYRGLTASISVNAVNIRSMQYAPSYVLKTSDMNSEIEKAVKLESGLITYEEAFKDVSFSGDSQIKALATNKLFTMDKITAEIGVSYDYLSDNFDTVVKKAQGTKVLILHYGINTLNASQADRQKRINQYHDLIVRLIGALPDVRIIVSGVFPVSRSIYSEQERYAYINDYDFSLLEMCMELGIEYYSNNEYIENHQEVFGSDGLHLTKEFYTNYWLKDLIITMGL